MTTEGRDGAIITSTEMDESYSPPPAPPVERKTALRSAWLPRIRMGERQWWTATLAATLLISALGIGLLYIDDSSNQATIRALNTQNESLTGRNQILLDQLKTTQTNLTATLGELAKTKADLAHPRLVLWNLPQPIKDNTWYLAGGIPDTFTYHLEATSTGPMSVSILTLEQWAKAVECVDFTGGSVHYCMHHNGTVMSFLSVTSVNYDFHLAEGCADYLSVFTSATSITVTPKVSVTYNPSSTQTGACA